MTEGIGSIQSSGGHASTTLDEISVEAGPIELPEISVGPGSEGLGGGGALPGSGSYGDPIAGFHQINQQAADNQRAFSASTAAASNAQNAAFEAQNAARSTQMQAQSQANFASMDAQRNALFAAPPVTGPMLPPNFAETARPPDPAGLDPNGVLAETAQTAGEAGVGYRGAMYGEVGAFSRTAQVAPEQQFGRFRENATLADPRYRGYGIDNFAGQNPWPQRTLLSTQATYDYARQEARLNNVPPGDVRFEVRDPAIANRIYDAQVGQAAPYTEVKAGKSINAGQFRIDTQAAANGARIDYQFAGNPLTGNHGPDPATAARLNAANAATGGNLTYGVAADIAPTRGQLQAVETAARFSEAARGFGRVAGPVGLIADGYSIYSGYQADGGRIGTNTVAETAGAAGGWAGAAAGGWGGVQVGTVVGGALGGPVGAPIGAVVGGVIGAVGGGFFGGWGAEAATRAAAQ